MSFIHERDGNGFKLADEKLSEVLRYVLMALNLKLLPPWVDQVEMKLKLL